MAYHAHEDYDWYSERKFYRSLVEARIIKESDPHVRRKPEEKGEKDGINCKSGQW